MKRKERERERARSVWPEATCSWAVADNRPLSVSQKVSRLSQSSALTRKKTGRWHAEICSISSCCGVLQRGGGSNSSPPSLGTTGVHLRSGVDCRDRAVMPSETASEMPPLLSGYCESDRSWTHQGTVQLDAHRYTSEHIITSTTHHSISRQVITCVYSIHIIMCHIHTHTYYTSLYISEHHIDIYTS